MMKLRLEQIMTTFQEERYRFEQEHSRKIALLEQTIA